MRFASTHESIERGEITILAICETLLAVIAVIMLSVWFDSLKWLAGAVTLAPLLLLRTEDSVKRGLGYGERLIAQFNYWLIVVLLASYLIFLFAMPAIWLGWIGWWIVPLGIALGGSVLP